MAAVSAVSSVAGLPSPAVGDAEVWAAYAPFIREGFVSMVGSGVQVPVKILWDTAAYNSFIVGSMLPFSAETDTGDAVLNRGLGLAVLPVPTHKVCLSCELVQGGGRFGGAAGVTIGRCPRHLGKQPAGSRSWAGVLPSPVACSESAVLWVIM